MSPVGLIYRDVVGITAVWIFYSYLEHTAVRKNCPQNLNPANHVLVGVASDSCSTGTKIVHWQIPASARFFEQPRRRDYRL